MTPLLLALWLGPAFVSTMLWAILTAAEYCDGGGAPSFGDAFGTLVGFFVPVFNFMPTWFLVAEAVSEFRTAF